MVFSEYGMRLGQMASKTPDKVADREKLIRMLRLLPHQATLSPFAGV